MISVKKAFSLKRSQLAPKFRVENNNLDISALIANSGYDARKIREFASSHRTERNRRATASRVFKYVQISDIDAHLGRIKSCRTVKGSEGPNNARRIMHYGDVLVSTRRPTRGAVVAVPREFDEEICTVFFTSLTIHDWEQVDPWYVALFLRTSLGRFQFQSLITETAYPVISDEDVKDIVVLLPPIDVQREMAGEYGEAVGAFSLKMKEAYTLITGARQEIENSLLGKEAEKLDVPYVGLSSEGIVGNDSGSGIEATNDDE